MLKLAPLVLASFVLVAILWRTESAAISGLFQSSPVETPPPVSSPTSTSESADATASPAPSQSPGATLTAAPAETASPTASTVATDPPPTDTPVASGTSETAEPEATPDESQRYPEGESNLKFEWGMLFDSLALFFSYVWLCCGILLFIAIPFLFFVLWRASSNRQDEGGDERGEQEEGEQDEGGQEEN